MPGTYADLLKKGNSRAGDSSQRGEDGSSDAKKSGQTAAKSGPTKQGAPSNENHGQRNAAGGHHIGEREKTTAAGNALMREPRGTRGSSSDRRNYVRKEGQVAATGRDEEAYYVLTLLTDDKIKRIMTDYRSKYFPRRTSNLDAHLTLFHALPGSRLESTIIPVLERVVSKSKPFGINAIMPKRTKKGIFTTVTEDNSAHRSCCAHTVHAELLNQWRPFLSSQDAREDRGGSLQLHYTIMNKVTDEKLIDKAMSEVMQDGRPVHGLAKGLSLYLFDRNEWRHSRDFLFQQGTDGPH